MKYLSSVSLEVLYCRPLPDGVYEAICDILGETASVTEVYVHGGRHGVLIEAFVDDASRFWKTSRDACTEGWVVEGIEEPRLIDVSGNACLEYQGEDVLRKGDPGYFDVCRCAA